MMRLQQNPKTLVPLAILLSSIPSLVGLILMIALFGNSLKNTGLKSAAWTFQSAQKLYNISSIISGVVTGLGIILSFFALVFFYMKKHSQDAVEKNNLKETVWVVGPAGVTATLTGAIVFCLSMFARKGNAKAITGLNYGGLVSSILLTIAIIAFIIFFIVKTVKGRSANLSANTSINSMYKAHTITSPVLNFEKSTISSNKYPINFKLLEVNWEKKYFEANESIAIHGGNCTLHYKNNTPYKLSLNILFENSFLNGEYRILSVGYSWRQSNDIKTYNFPYGTIFSKLDDSAACVYTEYGFIAFSTKGKDTIKSIHDKAKIIINEIKDVEKTIEASKHWTINKS